MIICHNNNAELIQILVPGSGVLLFQIAKEVGVALELAGRILRSTTEKA